MSSPDRNCFLAAARTASFIASITRSRSMPCSWQSASIFCAIDELIYVLTYSIVFLCCTEKKSIALSGVGPRLHPLPGSLWLSNQRNNPLAPCSIFQKQVVGVDSQQTTAEIALAANRLSRLHLRVATGEAFKVRALVKPSFESRRRNFQCVRSVDEVFHVQNRAKVRADFGAILVGNTLRLINEYTNNRLVLGAGYLGVYQLKAMVDCDLFS